MRKYTAVILLLVFFTSQYEKHIGYANCRITNYFKTGGNKCDCEKLLEDNSNPIDDTANPPAHSHHHPDESYFPPVNHKQHFSSSSNIAFSTIQSPALLPGDVDGIDRPPQIG